jgi:uncharacterized protein YwgA
MISITTRRRALLGAAILAALGGCAGNNPMSTASAMRVEVEVYKGPLSQPVANQVGELYAIIEEANEGLKGLEINITEREKYICSKPKNDSEDCKMITEVRGQVS